ncbi:hypothetical protein MNBD_BACTEROID04-2043, partial [hydrothermal vent metagenome]
DRADVQARKGKSRQDFLPPQEGYDLSEHEKNPPVKHPPGPERTESHYKGAGGYKGKGKKGAYYE